MAWDSYSVMTVARKSNNREYFAINGYAYNLQNTEELLAAPGVGKHIYLEQLFCTADIGPTGRIVIGSEENNEQVRNKLLDIVITGQGVRSPLLFEEPIQLPENESLTVDSTSLGPVSIFAEGYVI